MKIKMKQTMIKMVGTRVAQLAKHACLLMVVIAGGFPNIVAQDKNPWAPRRSVIQKFSKQPGFNYDESKVPDYILPDPLVGEDGSAVTTAKHWNESRRQEILNLFRDQVYGYRPEVKYKLEFEQTAEVKEALDGKAIGRSMIAKVSIGQRSFSWPFVLFIPKKMKESVPAIILINNRYFIPLEKAATEHDPFWSCTANH